MKTSRNLLDEKFSKNKKRRLKIFLDNLKTYFAKLFLQKKTIENEIIVDLFLIVTKIGLYGINNLSFKFVYKQVPLYVCIFPSVYKFVHANRWYSI